MSSKISISNLAKIDSLASIYFPVQKVPMNELIPGISTSSGLSHAIIAEPTKGEKVMVNACSKLYSLIPNKEILKPLAGMLDKEYDIRVSQVSVHDYAKTFVDLVFIKNGIEVMNKDDVFAKIRLVNSYDGSIKFYYNFGFFRLVCTNGLSVPVSQGTKFKSLHVMGEDMNLDNLSERLMKDTEKFLDNAGMMTEGFRDLANEKYKSMEAARKRIKEVLDYTAYPKKTAELAEQRLVTEHTEMGFQLTDYLVYNALNWALNNNEESKLQNHKIETVDAEVLNFLIKY